MRWRLILEEFGPELKYIKGENNVVADALSRLEKSPNQVILVIVAIELRDVQDLLIVTIFKATESFVNIVVFTFDNFQFKAKLLEY